MSKSVLVIDDEIDFAEMLGEELVLEGHRPVVTFSIEQALAEMKNSQFDLILCDYRMPKGGGEAFLSKCKGSLPAFYFLTGNIDLKIEDIEDSRVFDVLYKPVDFDRLKEILSSS